MEHCGNVGVWNGMRWGLAFFCCLFSFFLCPVFIFEDRILQGNAYKDPVLFEVFHIFVAVFRCSSFIL